MISAFASFPLPPFSAASPLPSHCLPTASPLFAALSFTLPHHSSCLLDYFCSASSLRYLPVAFLMPSAPRTLSPPFATALPSALCCPLPSFSPLLLHYPLPLQCPLPLCSPSIRQTRPTVLIPSPSTSTSSSRAAYILSVYTIPSQ